jgi:hypothetical protein
MTSRRDFLVASASAAAAVAVASACAPPTRPPSPVPTCAPPATGAPAPIPSPGSPGLIDETWFQGRVDDYLAHATGSLSPGNATNVVAHLVRAERDPSYSWDVGAVTVDAFSSSWRQLDDWKDTGDFTVMYLLWLRQRGSGIISADVIDAIDIRLREFRYRYDDPLPADRLDHKWFWSENHRVILAVDEYLAGTFMPDEVFVVTGLTGVEHAQRARPVILEWIDERARFGFSEWHSHVDMLKNITPLLTLIELCDDEELIRMASAALDLCLFDIAARTQQGAYGSTHGRTYKKDKMSSFDEDTFGTAKMLFDDTDRPYPSASDGGATYFSAALRYRMPEVIRRIAVSDEVHLVKERHGVVLDPHEPISLNPIAPYGYDYDDVDNLTFWWSHGALTTWHNVPVTMAAANRWRLWDTDLFREYDAIKPLANADPTVVKVLARELAPMVSPGLLGEAHTVTWRSPEVMLSSVVDHRRGDNMDQVHAWQATIDPDALVFTTHPSRPTPESLDWSEDRGYWTGTASMPRTAQWGPTSIHIYWPSYESPSDPLLGPVFGYLQETHAYFPQDHFDEVVQQDGWTFGRKGDGFVALWSYLPTTWRAYDPTKVATRGMVQPFDLVATGGSRNVWICEVGRRADHGSFESFIAGLVASAPVVDRPGGGGYRVRFSSPSAGALEWGVTGPLSVDGAAHRMRSNPRLDSPWGEVCALGRFLELDEGGSGLTIDFAKGTRELR